MLNLSNQLNSHRSSQRPSKDIQLLIINLRVHIRISKYRIRIHLQSLLIRESLTMPIAPIPHNQDIHFQLSIQSLYEKQPISNISRILMKVDYSVIILWSALLLDKPAVELHSVFGGDVDVFVEHIFFAGVSEAWGVGFGVFHGFAGKIGVVEHFFLHEVDQKEDDEEEEEEILAVV